MKKVILICVVMFLCGKSFGQHAPTSQYVSKTVAGWQVLVNKELLTKDAKLSDKVLKLLEHQLYQVTRVVPAPALKKIQKVRIWVEYDAPKHRCMCYHPNRNWLIKNDFNPDKAGSIEIANAKNFLVWTIGQPWMLLHELAHGYHHQVIGHDNAKINQAYKKAVASKSYESVLHISGKSRRAYALNNDREYFAECTEAFFGTNDFYPFVKSELKAHDPQMYQVLKDLWGK